MAKGDGQVSLPPSLSRPPCRGGGYSPRGRKYAEIARYRERGFLVRRNRRKCKALVGLAEIAHSSGRTDFRGIVGDSADRNGDRILPAFVLRFRKESRLAGETERQKRVNNEMSIWRRVEGITTLSSNRKLRNVIKQVIKQTRRR